MILFLQLLELLMLYRTCFRHFLQAVMMPEQNLYLTDTSRDIESLLKFSAVKGRFLKYNTAFPPPPVLQWKG